jgi:two-component system chemotaxis sensor kinase CheA
MSATMGYEDLASLTHQMENILDAIRQGQLAVTAELIDVVFSATDHLEEMVQSISEGGDGKCDVTDVIQKLKQLEKGEKLVQIATNKEVAAATELKNPSKNIYDEFELTVLQQSTEQGFHTYEITVTLREDCLLKAARVYMVFGVLENVGEVIKSNPTVEQLEEEQFDQEFTVTFVTMEHDKTIKQKVMNISEVENVEVVPFSPNEMRQHFVESNESFEQPVLEENAEMETMETVEPLSDETKKSSQKANLGNKTRDKALFLIIGVIGLGLNELGMFIFADVIGIHYLVSKVFIAGIVMLWNYLARKYFIFNLKFLKDEN